MKTNSFRLDRRIHELLQDEQFASITTRKMRDAYVSRLELEGVSHKVTDVRRYVYEQIRRMLRIGWLVFDQERRKRGQVYHVCPMPEHLQLALIDHGFETSHKSTRKVESVSPEPAYSTTPPDGEVEVHERLGIILKEVRLDFMASMGEAECYRQLFDEMPHLQNHLGREYREANDRSSRLLGHVQAIEKTINMLPSP